MDLINRQDAIDAIIADKIEDGLPVITDMQGRDFEVFNSSCDRHAKILKELPSAQKTGKWIVSDDKYWHTCPFCNADIDVSMGTGVYVDNDEVSHLNYCPHCGAKMEVKK